MIAKIVYTLCALTSFACMTLLLRGYLRTRFRLLFWSGLCFAGLTVNNVLLVMDRIVFTDVDLQPFRLSAALLAMLLLLYGLIYEDE
ncbi:MAG TPA: DUF5985 family protein [Burkholderiaceae bacterium]|nr:DUF5985 family protein [Burkholderiaceae bacterium]